MSSLALVAVAVLGEARAGGTHEAARSVLARALAGGKEVYVQVQILGMPMRGKVAEVSGKGVLVEASGVSQEVPWEKVPPGSLATAVMSAAEKGDEFLCAARLWKEAGFPDKAETATGRAVEADPALREQAEAFLRELRPESPGKGGPDLDALLGSKVVKVERKAAVRVNHAGRILPPMPPFSRPLMFDTKEADAVLSSMQIFPRDNPWNRDISKNPVHPRSDEMIANLGPDKPLFANFDMGFILVPPDQPRVEVRLGYPAESDQGPFPVPDDAPIEGWPMSGGELGELQRSGSGDRHMIVVDPVRMVLYEFYRAFRDDDGWRAACAARFDLKTNRMRPRGWTSADAAGLPIFPAVVRFDECERGMVEHAARVTFRHTRKAFLYPARHHASVPPTSDPAVPAMGQRFRLKADVDISGFPKHARAVALGLKKYGMFVADNGSDWYISVAPDRRLQGLKALSQLKGRDFEVVVTLDEHGRPQY